MITLVAVLLMYFVPTPPGTSYSSRKAPLMKIDRASGKTEKVMMLPSYRAHRLNSQLFAVPLDGELFVGFSNGVFWRMAACEPLD